MTPPDPRPPPPTGSPGGTVYDWARTGYPMSRPTHQASFHHMDLLDAASPGLKPHTGSWTLGYAPRRIKVGEHHVYVSLPKNHGLSPDPTSPEDSRSAPDSHRQPPVCRVGRRNGLPRGTRKGTNTGLREKYRGVLDSQVFGTKRKNEVKGKYQDTGTLLGKERDSDKGVDILPKLPDRTEYLKVSSQFLQGFRGISWGNQCSVLGGQTESGKWVGIRPPSPGRCPRTRRREASTTSGDDGG